MTAARGAVAAFLLASFALVATIIQPAEADQMDARLSDLFARLGASTGAGEARAIEGEIWSIWIDHGDERARRYMTAGIEQLESGQIRPAIITFTRLIEFEPKFAEAWNKRATAFYLIRDYDASARDIAETLKREPRHFGALSGLGLVNIALNRPEAAITAFEMALSHHPHLPGARQNIENLKEAIGRMGTPI